MRRWHGMAALALILVCSGCGSADWIQGTWLSQQDANTNITITEKTIKFTKGRKSRVSEYSIIESAKDRVAVRLEDNIFDRNPQHDVRTLEIARWHGTEKIKIDGAVYVRKAD